MSFNERKLPLKPRCPTGTCGSGPLEDQCNQLGVKYNEQHYANHGQWEELCEQAENCEDQTGKLKLWIQALTIYPNAKAASELAVIFSERGDQIQSLAFNGLAYALSSHNDKGTVRLAALLFEMGEVDRSAELVAETLNRNPDYGPAWNLCDRMGARS